MFSPPSLGQLFVLGVESPRFDAGLARLIEVEQVGGVITFARNLDSELAPEAAVEGLAELLAEVRACTRGAALPTPFLMVDHEGGRVHRFPGVVTHFPPPGLLAPAGPERIAAVCRQQADELRALGFNTILGPVLDVCPAEGSLSHIGARSFSGDPEEAAACGVLAVASFLERGLLPVAKHFPGYGVAPVDPHLDLPVRSDSLAALEASDLLVFRRAIEAGLPALMSAHLVTRALDPEQPGTLSPRCLAYLRETLGFEGCVVSDDLCMGALRAPLPELSERALRAGLDLLLICHPEPETLRACTEHLAEVARAEPAFAARLQEALARVARAREGLDPSPAPAREASLFAKGAALRASLPGATA